MVTVQVQMRKWGQSLGVVIPKEIVSKDSLKEGEKIELIILKRTNALKETF
ncbi:MAG: AbrB/MazE/SpoVT family DNA-binding domain-containing protein [bacterium]|nr:AbrB/MazE/SpoVT family DNA-binding domain-containing protein [bacterium]